MQESQYPISTVLYHYFDIHIALCQLCVSKLLWFLVKMELIIGSRYLNPLSATIRLELSGHCSRKSRSAWSMQQTEHVPASPPAADALDLDLGHFALDRLATRNLHVALTSQRFLHQHQEIVHIRPYVYHHFRNHQGLIQSFFMDPWVNNLADTLTLASLDLQSSVLVRTFRNVLFYGRPYFMVEVPRTSNSQTSCPIPIHPPPLNYLETSLSELPQRINTAVEL